MAKHRKENGSCVLLNSGKHFFLRLAARVVREVSNQRDEDSLIYPRKTMILTGIGLKTNGLSKVLQLTPKLPEII